MNCILGGGLEGKEEGGAIVDGTEKEEAEAAPRTRQGQEAFPRGQG